MTAPKLTYTICRYNGPIGKTFRQGRNGIEKSVHGFPASGSAVEQSSTLAEFAEYIDSAPSNEIVTLSQLKDRKLATRRVRLMLEDRCKPGTVARSNTHLVDVPGPAIMGFDHDTAGEQEPHARLLSGFREWLSILTDVEPAFAEAGHVARQSSSGRVHHKGRRYSAKSSFHCFFGVNDGTQIKRVALALEARLWLAGYGWLLITANTQCRSRTIFDTSVYQPSRPWFVADPIVVPPVALDPPTTFVRNGPLIDLSQIADPSPTELQEVKRLKDEARQNLVDSGYLPEAEARFIRNQREARVKAGADPIEAERQTRREMAYGNCTPLLPTAVLTFKRLGSVTVAEVLREPMRYHKMSLKDPHEPDYPKSKWPATFFATGHRPAINSWAHGARVFVLSDGLEPEPIQMNHRLARQLCAALAALPPDRVSETNLRRVACALRFYGEAGKAMFMTWRGGTVEALNTWETCAGLYQTNFKFVLWLAKQHKAAVGRAA